MLVLYPITLMNSLISSTGFLAYYLGFSTHMIMSQANRHIFISPYMPFLIYLPFFFSYLIAMTGTSNIMINNSENKHLCHLDLDHRRKVFILSSNVTLTVCFIKLRKQPSIPTFLKILVMNGIQLCQMLFLQQLI